MRLKMVIVFLLGSLLAAGCGGGSGDSSSQQAGKGNGDQKTQEKANQKDKKGGRAGDKLETVSGTITKTSPENENIFVFRPEDGKNMVITAGAKNVEITLDGEEAAPQDIEQGQNAEVEFVTKEGKEGKELNIARTVTLTSAAEPSAEETTS